MEEAKVHCRRCGSDQHIKAGFVQSKQRYKCLDCYFHFTLNGKGVREDVKRLAVHLFLEGMSYRAISRVTGVSDVAIAKWIRPVRNELDPIRKRTIKTTELHKLEHFFITKELFNKFGWLLIGTEENEGICLFGSYTTGNLKIE